MINLEDKKMHVSERNKSQCLCMIDLVPANDTLEKAKGCGHSKTSSGNQWLERKKRWLSSAQEICRAVKSSMWFYKGGYMSLGHFQSQKIHHSKNDLWSKAWIWEVILCLSVHIISNKCPFLVKYGKAGWIDSIWELENASCSFLLWV